jgi:hypothetical protein
MCHGSLRSDDSFRELGTLQVLWLVLVAWYSYEPRLALMNWYSQM